MYKTVVRIYRVPPQVRGDIQSFLEGLSKRIRTPIASIAVKGDIVRVELSGSREQVYESLEALRRFFDEYKVSVGRKVRVLTFNRIEDMAGSRVPVDTLEELLKLRGYPARRRAKKSIETTAPREVIVEEARRLGEAYRKVREERLSESTMKMVAVAAAYLGVEPREVIEKAIEIGVITRDSDGKLRIGYAWRGALREVIRAYRSRS